MYMCSHYLQSEVSYMYNNVIAIHHNCGNHKLLNTHDCVKWATLSDTHIPVIKFKLVCERHVCLYMKLSKI